MNIAEEQLLGSEITYQYRGASADRTEHIGVILGVTSDKEGRFHFLIETEGENGKLQQISINTHDLWLTYESTDARQFLEGEAEEGDDILDILPSQATPA